MGWINNANEYEDKITEKDKTIKNLNDRIRILEGTVASLQQDVKDREELLNKKITEENFMIVHREDLNTLIEAVKSCVPHFDNYKQIEGAVHAIDIMKKVYNEKEKGVIL